MSLHQRFKKMAAKYPSRVAVRAGNRSLTYAELNQQANRIAHVILEYLGPGSEPVAFLCDDRIYQTTAILGLLKVGKWYMPLDAANPKERNAFFRRDSSATIVLCDADGFKTACDTVGSDNLVRLDCLDPNVSDEDPKLSISPEAYAYIMYTSGSTGEPKGIVDNHRNILNEVMYYTNKVHVCSEDRLTLLHSLSVRTSELNFYAALLNGATVCFYDVKREGVSHCSQWLREQGVTIFHSTPSLFRYLAEHFTGTDQARCVRLVHLSGAPVKKRDVELWEKYFPEHCFFLHRMGTTETGTVSWRFIAQSSDIPGNKVPLGWAPEGKKILILDEKRDEVGLDQVGQIAVKSRYISRGYWKKPELTKTKYLTNSSGSDDETIYLTGDLGYQTAADGLFHLGRKDFQIKIRGYRIEASEVEAALSEHSNIKEAVVVGHESEAKDSYLAAYIVPANRPGPGVSELRGFVKSRLPDYMVPSAFIFLDALPLNPNGKLDRNALPKPGRARPDLATAFVAARSQLEDSLAGIWGEVLSLDQVGIHDNFFDLGGHSLAATRVVTRVLQRYQLQIPLQALFASPTVAEMALVVFKSENIKRGAIGLDAVLKDLESLSDIEAEQMLDREKSKKVSRP